ncbi:hypothetical protein BG006_011186 [Podila minutissima]|uniref:Uncharacterized protein n=1 Tax=Podila minutissima TaxID=64525 RepID=A0A9P5SQN0_9FUNG|nr:hypothetical protein BG006_011186 [Podila minutissima]
MQVTWLSLKSFALRVSNMGNGNTALLFANQRLLALEEAGLPFELTVPALESVGEYHFGLQVLLIQNPATHLKRNIPILAFEEDKPAKFGVFPRHFDPKKDEVIWFESRTCHIFHTSQAWEEKDSEGNVVAVCMTGCRSNRLSCEITKFGKTDETTYRGGKTLEELGKHIPP